MAKILYKKGCGGQNRLECIEGIQVYTFGSPLIIYPKYAILPLRGEMPIRMCKGKRRSLIEQLAACDEYRDYMFWASNHSPAIEFIDRINSGAGRYLFSLPALPSALEISYRWKEIDDIASSIDGADLIDNFSRSVWSSSIHTKKIGIACMDGDIDYCNLRYEMLIVPSFFLH